MIKEKDLVIELKLTVKECSHLSQILFDVCKYYKWSKKQPECNMKDYVQNLKNIAYGVALRVMDLEDKNPIMQEYKQSVMQGDI